MSNEAEEFEILSRKLNQLKLEYEQYFMGSRPREPVVSRNEIQKQVIRFANSHIQNTGERFKFNTLNNRFHVEFFCPTLLVAIPVP